MRILDPAKVFAIDSAGIKPVRGLIVLVAMLVPLAVLSSLELERYWLVSRSPCCSPH